MTPEGEKTAEISGNTITFPRKDDTDDILSRNRANDKIQDKRERPKQRARRLMLRVFFCIH